MHDGELPIDANLVAALIADQFPQWSALPLERVDSTGTVHAIYRLGNDMAVRLPLLARYAPELLKETEWLPKLAPHLPLATPVPVAQGAPGHGYQLPWSVVTWIEGDNATLETLADPVRAAGQLGEFVRVLRGLDTRGAEIHEYRGRPLVGRDMLTRQAIQQVTNEFPESELTGAWEKALASSDWGGKPVWFHGDLHSGNLLSHHGQLTAVIDFGGLGTGDPAIDTIAAWWLFSGESRAAFRRAAELDEDLWERGRGWALSVALIALPYYVHSNPRFAEMCRGTIGEVLRDR
jgi:aminoglycoside phosphotransferase (APT) family kinase protein